MSDYFGPWRYEESTHSILDKDDDLVIDADSGDFTAHEREKNANLIAAAPELLEVCLRIQAQFSQAGVASVAGSLNPAEDAAAQIDAVIAKALGKQGDGNE